ncbi:penicillin-binding protein 2 [Quadrisphaera sp. DSM 44207]|uniref:peptidoglycan D,D-transpeptidase FtsI family protein n=1 Tax=Quadrisphaera sp. DSM 44207 TaxID=1881057 RepID=UPI00088CD523|nr:penicillin-binding protein 2 [Quadrisphaera sp. DSM 44207]SDQ22732.1 cell elongation-specific peptidoglycan D,D-transpeptidase [Quadrisphaera sp. DSM 44207]
MNGPLRRLSVIVVSLFVVLMGAGTWVQFVTAGRLQDDPRNSRALFAELGRERGPILVEGEAVALSEEVDDRFRYQRLYPAGPLWAHATGVYSVVFGATGLEEAANDLLSGTSDDLFYRRLSDLLTGREPGGAVVETTLDAAVQEAAAQALGDQEGAVVALDPRTGEVLAMVSSPSYDPNALASHDAEAVRAARQELLEDPGDPLVNRAIGGDLYPPGSVFKLVTAAAALEAGSTPESALTGVAELDLPQTTATIGNSGGGGCGSGGQVSLADALRVSCNTAFAALGMELGTDALVERARAFGFGEELSIPLRVTPSSVPASMAPPQLAQASIGQYEVRVTPLQVAVLSAAVANGGVVMRPNLVSAVRGDDLEVLQAPEPTELGRATSEQTAQALTAMMVGVVESGTGTAAQVDGVQVAGKTGTAQHAEGRAPHAWFTGFAPAGDPRVAVAVVVEEGGSAGDQASGGRTAAPIAREVVEAVLAQ